MDWTNKSAKNESGILRKISNYQNEEPPNLLVFGYQCKIFRDDERALFIDQQKHLIPWMGDPNLKIDRYDVRGALHDLTPYEAPSGGYGNRLEYLSPSEQRAELLCEEERYYSLFKNEVEEELYKEEENKRAASSYSEVAFNYEEIGPKEPDPATEADQDDSDEPPFVPPPSLVIPDDMELPTTQKHHAIIEKTAKFIASQGLQMEILLKTKQANNAQFDFLNHDGKYNSYYKFILQLMKSNSYQFSESTSGDIKSEENSQQSEDSCFNVQTDESESAVRVPTISYKPSNDCVYTQLISKVTGRPISSISASIPTNGNATETNDVEVKKISSGLMGLVQHYNSDSETDNENDQDENDASESNSTRLSVYDGPLPPEDLQLTIDKTSAYVAKNGADFEEILRTKQDPRFLFLNENNEFHAYYVFKVNQMRYPYTKATKPQNSQQKAVTKPNLPSSTKQSQKDDEPKNKIITPISFLIKAKDENTVPLKSTVLPGSDEEANRRRAEISKNETDSRNESPSRDNDLAIEELEKQIENIPESKEKREARLAAEKLKDKLALAAREKLSMLSREKQLQIERKKKAMMFLQQLQNSNNPSAILASTSSNGNNNDDDDNQDEDLEKYNLEIFVPNKEHEKENKGKSSENKIYHVDSDDDSIYSIPSPPKDIIIEKKRTRSRTRTRTRTRSISRSRRRSYSKSKSRSRKRSSSSRSYSRSRSRSRSSAKHHKKSKRSHHSKKKTKRKRSRSYSRYDSRSRSRSKHSSHKRKRSRSRERRHRR